MAGGAGRLEVLAADDAYCSGPCRPGATTVGLGRRSAGPRVSTAPANSAGAAGAGAREAISHVAGATDRTAATGSRTVVADTHGGGG